MGVKAKEMLIGFARVNQVTSTLRYPLSVFNKNSLLKNSTCRPNRKYTQTSLAHYEFCKRRHGGMKQHNHKL